MSLFYVINLSVFGPDVSAEEAVVCLAITACVFSFQQCSHTLSRLQHTWSLYNGRYLKGTRYCT
jgi:hypothetical protein